MDNYLVKYINDFASNNNLEKYTHEPIKFTAINTAEAEVTLEQMFMFQNEYIFLTDIFYVDVKSEGKVAITRNTMIKLSSSNDIESIIDPLYNHLRYSKIKIFSDYLKISISKMPSSYIMVLEGIKLSIKKIKDKPQ